MNQHNNHKYKDEKVKLIVNELKEKQNLEQITSITILRQKNVLLKKELADCKSQLEKANDQIAVLQIKNDMHNIERDQGDSVAVH